MDMKINVELMKRLRAEKSWSQDELATAASLSSRTIQRIEKDGNSSLESKKAIASAFDIKAAELHFNAESSVYPDSDSENVYFRIDNGTNLSEVIGGAYAHRLNHDDPKTDSEAEVLASAAQSVQDWGDIWSDLEAGDRVKATFELSSLINDLEASGFWVFGLRTNEAYPGSKGDKWPVANVFLMREDNPKIIKLDLSNQG